MKRVYLMLLLSIVFSINNIEAQTNKGKKMENTKETRVLIKTTKGDITVKLYDETPYHRDNFIKLVNEKYYDGVLFHRVIDGFMIQGGDPESKTAKQGQMLGNGGPDYTLAAELTPKFYHKKGALAAARTGDQGNPTRRSSGSQFYIVTGKVYTNEELNKIENAYKTKFTEEQRKDYTTIGGAPFLDGQYTVFGEVEKGIDVAVSISRVPRDKNDRPIEDVKIISMQIIK